ncbi:MAG: hypothetical protein ABXS92_04310 [Sulfurimonas sp.]
MVGCSVKPTLPANQNIHRFSKQLQGLDADITVKESHLLAGDIYKKANELAKAFKLVSPPQFHNFLVNVGLKERGLCYHFSDALYQHLKSKHYASFEFHLVGANIGEYWKEHNALAVVPKRCKSERCIMENGIVIDAWRDSGKLYFSALKEDKRYQWEHRAKRCRAL